MSQTLIPGNGRRLQHDLARLTQQEADALDIDLISRSRSPELCDAHWLPWLAWEWSVGDEEGWEFAETEEVRRRLIAGFAELHHYKGTPYAIRRLFRLLDLGEVDIIERAALLRWNGAASFNGVHVFGGGPGDWAKYAIVCRRPVTNRQGDLIRRMLDGIAPRRCELLYIDFRHTALLWNGEIDFDGTYNFGAA